MEITFFRMCNVYIAQRTIDTTGTTDGVRPWNICRTRLKNAHVNLTIHTYYFDVDERLCPSDSV